MYTLFYVSENVHEGEPTGEWSVYSEVYPSFDSEEPIEGSTVLVDTCVTRQSADRVAKARQRQSYSANRRERASASQD